MKIEVRNALYPSFVEMHDCATALYNGLVEPNQFLLTADKRDALKALLWEYTTESKSHRESVVGDIINELEQQQNG